MFTAALLIFFEVLIRVSIVLFVVLYFLCYPKCNSLQDINLDYCSSVGLHNPWNSPQCNLKIKSLIILMLMHLIRGYNLFTFSFSVFYGKSQQFFKYFFFVGLTSSWSAYWSASVVQFFCFIFSSFSSKKEKQIMKWKWFSMFRDNNYVYTRKWTLPCFGNSTTLPTPTHNSLIQNRK